MPPDFDSKDYWHERFATETSFEWLVPSAAVLEIAAPYLDALPEGPEPPRILHLGSGTSDLHNHLRARGLERVTNIDYEPRALERGRDLERARFGDVKTRYAVADLTRSSRSLEEDLAAADAEEAGGGVDLAGRYDVALDKGTADAIACGGDDAVRAMAENVWRCLSPRGDDGGGGGFWISLSYSSTRFDDVRDLFDVEVIHKIPTAKAKPTDPDVFHYCYLLRPKRSGGISVNSACSAASEAITRASLAINKFVRDVRECRAEFDAISAELHSLDSVLGLLGYDAPFFPPTLAEHTPAVLDTCLALLNELEGCVSLLGSPAASRTEKKSRWLANRGHIDLLRWTLGEYKVVLGLAADLVGVIKPQTTEKQDRGALEGRSGSQDDNADELVAVTARIIKVASDSDKDWQQSVALAKLGQYLNVLQVAAVSSKMRDTQPQMERRRRGGYVSPTWQDSAIDMAYDGDRRPSVARSAASSQPRSKAEESWLDGLDEMEDFIGELTEMPHQSPPPIPRRSGSRLSSAAGSHASSTRGMGSPDLYWSPAATFSSPRTSDFSSTSSSSFVPQNIPEHSCWSPVSTNTEQTTRSIPLYPLSRRRSQRGSFDSDPTYSIFENPRTILPPPRTNIPTPTAPTPVPPTPVPGSGPDSRPVPDRPPSGRRRSSNKLSDAFRNLALRRRPSANPVAANATGKTPPASPKPASSNAVFGVPLAESIQLARGVASAQHDNSGSSSAREYPLCVLKCVGYIQDHGIEVPHIFGEDGDAMRVVRLRELFSSPVHGYGRNVDLAGGSHGFTVHDAAELVLLFLAELPKPLVPESVGKRWVVLSRQATMASGGLLDRGLDFWEEALAGMRGPARALFKLLLNLWGDITSRAHVNEMTAERLAGRVIRSLMQEAATKKFTDYLLGLAFLIRKRSDDLAAARRGTKKTKGF
ncbi:hypothetical protein VTJ49DRAFT_3622 [Mycothermus thermophilus]|uniref:Rho-GAP domain-containing protein n=1 Tax=Humicola insolens TaxID=85995 RepID=A0ABR3V761_HUMIN